MRQLLPRLLIISVGAGLDVPLSAADWSESTGWQNHLLPGPLYHLRLVCYRKREPNDVDIFLLMDDSFDVRRVSPEARLVFDHGMAQNALGAGSIFDSPQSGNRRRR